MLEEPELVTLLPEEDNEDPPSLDWELKKKLAIQFTVVVVLKVATGLAIRKFARTVREMDLLYPESFERVRWDRT